MLTRRRIITASAILALVLFTVISNIVAAPREHTAAVVFIPDNELLPMLVKDLANAKADITCSIYMFKTDGLNNDTTAVILGAMLDALSRGVTVSILMDIGDEDDLSNEYNIPTGKILENAGAVVMYDDPERRLHTKLCVIDKELVYIGSHNYTFSVLSRNAEASVRIRSPEIAAEAIQYIFKTYDLAEHVK